MYNISYSHKGNVDVEKNKIIAEIQSIDYKNRQRPVSRHDLQIDTGALANKGYYVIYAKSRLLYFAGSP
jgi:hypothetical protein